MRTILGKKLPFTHWEEQLEQEGQPAKERIISINDKVRRSGMYILGVPDSGKSFLFANLIRQDLQKGYPVIVLDAHGDLIRHVISLLPPERRNKTYLLDLTDTNHPFGLNLFACSDATNEWDRAKVVERVMHVFERHWPESKGILLGKLLRYITHTILECPEYTLADVPRLLWDDTFRANIVSRLTNEAVKAYWQVEYNAMRPDERRNELKALDNRLAAFLADPIVRNIVCQRETSIDFRRAILEHQVVLINLPMKDLPEQAALIGTIVLTNIYAATFAFRELEWDQRPGFSLFVDEFQNFATSDFAELFKEGRKYGARIVVAHQDRHDLLPENRSATLSASIFISFLSTLNDAIEISPLFVDVTIKLRPDHIYPDVLNRLRLDERHEIYEFFHDYVLPHLDTRDRERRHQLELLRDLLYQSVKTGSINQKLFNNYAERMYPILKLTFAAPEQKRKQLREQLQRHEDRIAKLAAFLTSDRAFRDYLVAYHSYFSAYSWHYRIDWSNRPFVSEEVLLKDAAFWHYILNDTSNPLRERFETIMNWLEYYTEENDVLSRRDTVEKIISIEREKIVEWRGGSLRSIWKKIATIHELNGKYATNEAVRAFHASAHRACLTVPDEQKGDPVYLHPVGSSAGNISAHTRVDELLIQPLPFRRSSRIDAAEWLADAPGQPIGRGGARAEEIVQARATVMSLWPEIIDELNRRQQVAESLADDATVLQDYYAELAKYPALQSLWYELSGGNTDADVWDMVRKEAQRNAYRSGQLNTVEKLIQMRKDELQKKITLLIAEQDAFKATMPPVEKRIRQEVDAIEQQRANFRTYLRRIIQRLIDEPGPLAKERTLKESDIKQMLLDLPKRQALVRVGGSIEHGPRIYRMQTLDVPQAAKRDEVERWVHQIRLQTHAKYCRSCSEVERDLGYKQMNAPSEDEERHEDEPPNSWYEE